MQQRRFAKRFLEHLDKIGPAEIQNFVFRMARERDLTARIFETLTEGIVVFDAQANVSLVNSAARRILQWSSNRRVTGEPILELLQEGPLQHLVETFLNDPAPVRDRELAVRDRSRKIFNVHLLPIAEETVLEADSESFLSAEDALAESTGGNSGAALVLQDLTLVRARQERDAQEQRIASLATLTAGVAHDIKNPLNSLSIHAQLLERSVADLTLPARGKSGRTIERITQSCSILREEVERLRKCVDDFIEAARPRKPILQLQDLNRLVLAILEMSRMELEHLQIQVETYLDPDLPALLIDEKQMIHALRNLMRNAIEAIAAARRKPGTGHISLHTSLLDDTAALEIRDNGCGIPKGDLPKVFEPYYTTKFNGSGLGLMAVGRIVREHGGEISLTSTEHEGTAITLELPAVSRRVKLLESR